MSEATRPADPVEEHRRQLATLVAGRIARLMFDQMPVVEEAVQAQRQASINTRVRFYRAENGTGELRCAIEFEVQTPSAAEYRVGRSETGELSIEET